MNQLKSVLLMALVLPLKMERVRNIFSESRFGLAVRR